MTPFDKLEVQLDKDQPSWYIEWATGTELLQYSENMLRAREFKEPTIEVITTHHKRCVDKLKFAVRQRLFHRILNASISAGIMTEQS